MATESIQPITPKKAPPLGGSAAPIPVDTMSPQSTKRDPSTDLIPPTPPKSTDVAFPFPVPTGAPPPETNIEQRDSPGVGSQPGTTVTPQAGASPTPLFDGSNLGADSAAGGALNGFANEAPGVTSDQTVAGQLGDLFSNRAVNPLFQKAAGDAAQYANSRGLQNSDIAAEAGQQAVFAAALPIASQDANTFAQRAQQEAQFWQSAGLRSFDATIQSGLMAQDHLQKIVELTTQGDINSKLQLEQFGYNWDLSAQENLQQMQRQALQGDINAKLALQAFGFDSSLMEQDFGYRAKLQDLELRNALSLSAQDNTQWLERIAATHTNTLEEISARGDEQQFAFTRDLQQNYLLSTERRTLQFSAEVQAIYSQEGLTAGQQANAVNVARRNFETDIAMLQNFYSRSPLWDTNWGTGANTSPPETVPGGPGPPELRPPTPGPAPGITPPPPGTPPGTLPFQPLPGDRGQFG